MKPLTALSDLLVDWPDSAPQSLTEVWNSEPEELPEAGRQLRRHLVDVRNSFDSSPVLTPDDVRVLLERRLLRPLPAAWLAVPLDASRRRVLAPTVTDETLQQVVAASSAGSLSQVRRVLASPAATRWAWASYVSRHVPTLQALEDRVPLHPHGVYLLVYGGCPSVVDEPKVTDQLVRLLASVPVADVVFWSLRPGQAPACFSLGARRGEAGGEPVDFPCSQNNLERLVGALGKEET